MSVDTLAIENGNERYSSEQQHLSPFEANEKRLEIDFLFIGNDEHFDPRKGLRLLSRKDVESILPCTIVSQASGGHCDAYVLSESSLFIYPTKWIIKTCGTVGLFRCLPALVSSARRIGLEVSRCEYSRSDYLFPHAQPFPHACFEAETSHLERELSENLGIELDEEASDAISIHDWTSAALERPDLPLRAWFAFEAIASKRTAQLKQQQQIQEDDDDPNFFTRIEIRMTGLESCSACRFFHCFPCASEVDREKKNTVTSEIRKLLLTGIGNSDSENEHAVASAADAHMFTPCGYSMNGFLECGGFYTVHVTPQEPGSYASVEIFGRESNVYANIQTLIRDVVGYFSPSRVMMVSRKCAKCAECAEWDVDFENFRNTDYQKDATTIT